MNHHELPKILILGASGMLGNTLFRYFSADENFQTFGTVRSASALQLLPEKMHPRVITNVHVENLDLLSKLFAEIRPNIAINCIGIVKQCTESDDPFTAIPINALLPHRLANLCTLVGARLIHMGTDCVFSGSNGMYTEADIPDAVDLYGRSKLLGELSYPHTITLRTSIVGHELSGNTSLVNWFLSQEGSVKGFVKAVFSGLPAVEIAAVIRDHVIPRPDLHGLYHLSASPINKFDFLKLVGQIYEKDIEIVADSQLTIDRSLDSGRFKLATSYAPKSWPDLVQSMHAFR
jgi:dTDP-4-dehydrorhamnose reductase